MSGVLKVLVRKRINILIVTGISLYFAITYFKISLWYFLLASAFTCLVFGKYSADGHARTAV